LVNAECLDPTIGPYEDIKKREGCIQSRLDNCAITARKHFTKIYTINFNSIKPLRQLERNPSSPNAILKGMPIDVQQWFREMCCVVGEYINISWVVLFKYIRTGVDNINKALLGIYV
jgi:hypothetical protein